MYLRILILSSNSESYRVVRNFFKLLILNNLKDTKSLNWYNNCEGRLVYHNIDPYARKINHKSAPKEVVNALVTLYHQGKFDDVLSRSSQLIKEYPQTFVLHNIMGAISFEKGQEEVAIEHFVKSLNYYHHPHAYNNLGATLLDIGEYEEAKSHLKKAIELQPDYAEAYNNLGMFIKRWKNIIRQSLFMKKRSNLILKLWAYQSGGSIGNNERYEEAEKVLKQVIKLQPEFVGL